MGRIAAFTFGNFEVNQIDAAMQQVPVTITVCGGADAVRENSGEKAAEGSGAEKGHGVVTHHAGAVYLPRREIERWCC